MDVITICGSLRKGSYNRMVMNTLPSVAPAGMKLSELSGYDKFPHYVADLHADGKFPEAVTNFADRIRAADAIIINSPEYNYTIPGALKNGIDWVSRLKDQPFKHKPVAIQSASQGPLGGARMQYHMRQMFVFLNAFVFNTPEIFVGTAQNKFNDKGELTDETTRDFLKKQLEAFQKFVERVRV
ncbi:MAG TPA: NAD(P)H-dependent oxidoreductase [Xanthobacteraceae bacterium]|nr:NAD(P)H-dependent oxidoreductase [Xanthobacteraceae bacterium]